MKGTVSYKNRFPIIMKLYWLLSSSAKSDRKRFIKVIAAIIYVYNIFSFLFSLYFVAKATNEPIMSLFITVNIGVVSLKSHTLYTGCGDIEELLNLFQNSFDETTLDRSKRDEMVFKSTKKSYVFYIALTCCYGVSVAFLSLRPLFVNILYGTTHLPLIHSRALTSFFKTEYFFQTIGFLCLVVSVYTADILYISSSNFIQAHLKVTVCEMDELESNTSRKKMNEMLRNIIKKHVLLIKCNRLLNQAFDFTLFIQMSASTMGICFAMVLKNDSFMQLVLPTQILEISMFCYFGQILEDQSIELETAVYRLPWVEMTVENRKFVLLMLRQAQRTLVSSAGPFNNLSHDTLKSIFQGAYSFYAVLKTD